MCTVTSKQLETGVKISKSMVAPTYNPRIWESEVGRLLRGSLHNSSMVRSRPALAMVQDRDSNQNLIKTHIKK